MLTSNIYVTILIKGKNSRRARKARNILEARKRRHSSFTFILNLEIVTGLPAKNPTQEYPILIFMHITLCDVLSKCGNHSVMRRPG